MRKPASNADAEQLQSLRRQITSGRLERRALRSACDARTSYQPNEHGHGHLGYDRLDDFVDALLGTSPLRCPKTPLDPGNIPYQPAPARAVLDLVDHAPLRAEDVLFDLGSGLGRVALLAHLLTGCTALGVELEAEYAQRARVAAGALRLTGVEFVSADLVHHDLSAASVLFIFNAVGGSQLQRLCHRVQEEAGRRPLRVCALGACAWELARLPTLQTTAGDPSDPACLTVLVSVPAE